MLKKLVLIILLLLLALPAEALSPTVARTRVSGSYVQLTDGVPLDIELKNPINNEDRWANAVYVFNDTYETIYVNLTGTDATGNSVSANTVSADCIRIVSTDTTYGPLIFDPLYTHRVSVTPTIIGDALGGAGSIPIIRFIFLFEE